MPHLYVTVSGVRMGVCSISLALKVASARTRRGTGRPPRALARRDLGRDPFFGGSIDLAFNRRRGSVFSRLAPGRLAFITSSGAHGETVSEANAAASDSVAPRFLGSLTPAVSGSR